jgi:phytoene synthase
MANAPSIERAAELTENYSHCERILREGDRDHWLACLFAPSEKRRYLHAIYAFCHEIAGVREKVTQPLLGEMRLRWWMDALEAPTGVETMGGAHAHPVADALLDAIERNNLPRAHLLDIIEAHIFDLYDDAMDGVAELEIYCSRTSARPMRLSAQILSGDGDVARETFEHAGVALGLTQVLRDLPKQAAAGQMFAPKTLLARCGATEEDMRRGVATPAVREVLAELRACARAHYHAARSKAREAGAAQAALLPAALAPIYLEPMERSDYEPFHAQNAPAQWRRQWRLWRAASGKGL